MRSLTGCSFLLVVLVVWLWAFPGAYSQEIVYLVKDGTSDHKIVVAASASPSEKRAAEELQSHFKACTGVELPIVAEAPADGAPMIVLGCGPVAQGLGVDPKPDELGEQGYLIRTVSPHLVIAGTPMAGTMYGVYDFLEQYLGVRWYAPGLTKTPEVKELPLPKVDRLFQPTFAWRCTSYAWPGKDAEFLARMRGNSGGGGPDHPYGIQHTHDGRAHSYFRFVSLGEFFDTHPEYFSEIGGIRRIADTQLCLTNPEVIEIVTERMLKRMAENPNCRQHNFSQMDYYNYCECEHCMEINKKYGAMGGTQFWFVNQLAERTSKVYPDKLIGTLAYIYTEEPPKGIVMHPNVAVWLCHMFPSCDSHPIATCPHNADYKRRAIAWSKICSHLYIWHYIVDFAHYYNPFPNFDALAANIRFYRDIGVEGIYLQAMGHGGGGGEFSLLRPYYGMKLAWDPDQDADAIMRDFLEGHYGAAWEPIYKYIRMLQAKVDDENIHMHLYTNPAQGYLPDDILEKADALFDEAEAAVEDDEGLLERVRVARMPLTYARLFPRNGYKIENGTLVFQGEFADMTAAAEMANRMQEHGFRTLREMWGDPAQLAMFCALLNAPVVAPSIKNEHLTVDTVPFLGGRALRIMHNQSGKFVTAHNRTRSLFFPFCGGEETRYAGIFRPAGFYDQYAVTERTDTSITLTAESGGLLAAKSGDFDIQRTLMLKPGAPVLIVENKFTNVTDKPIEVAIRSHCNLDLGDLHKTRLSFVNRAGETVERDMKPIIAGMREGEHYLDENAPNGSWTFTGNKGLELTQTFDADQLDFTWVYAYPAYINDLEVEVWAKPVTVAPGESATFANAIEIQPMPK